MLVGKVFISVFRIKVLLYFLVKGRYATTTYQNGNVGATGGVENINDCRGCTAG